VSDHPEGRFGASGRLAASLVEHVPWDDYYGPDSPLERLVHAGGRVLRLGADLGTVTVIHYAEYLAPIPVKRRVRRHRVVAGTDPSCASRPPRRQRRHRQYPSGDCFAVILREYLAAGRIDWIRRRATSGSSTPCIVEFAVRMAEHLVTE
jgi:aminoglycoside N3'-acetyltransferase